MGSHSFHGIIFLKTSFSDSHYQSKGLLGIIKDIYEVDDHPDGVKDDFEKQNKTGLI